MNELVTFNGMSEEELYAQYDSLYEVEKRTEARTLRAAFIKSKLSEEEFVVSDTFKQFIFEEAETLAGDYLQEKIRSGADANEVKKEASLLNAFLHTFLSKQEMIKPQYNYTKELLLIELLIANESWYKGILVKTLFSLYNDKSVQQYLWDLANEVENRYPQLVGLNKEILSGAGETEYLAEISSIISTVTAETKENAQLLMTLLAIYKWANEDTAGAKSYIKKALSVTEETEMLNGVLRFIEKQI